MTYGEQSGQDQWSSLIDEHKGKIAIIVLLLLLALFYFLFFAVPPTTPAGPDTVRVTLSVQDVQGRSLSGITATYKAGEERGETESDSRGKLKMRLPSNSDLSVNIPPAQLGEREFEAHAETFVLGEQDFEDIITLREKTTASRTRVLRFEDEGGRIIGEDLEAQVTCSNPAIPPFTVRDEDRDGLITIQPPLNCGDMTVTAKGEKHQDAIITITDQGPDGTGQGVINLQRHTPETGSLRVRLVDGTGALIVDASIRVVAASLQQTEEKDSGFYGVVRFENLLPGTYDLVASDASGNYPPENKTGVVVEAGRETLQILTLAKEIKGVLILKPRDAVTGEPIPNSKVTVQDSNGRVIARGETDDFDNQVEVPVDTGQSIFVRVADPDTNELIENARVIVRDKHGNIVADVVLPTGEGLIELPADAEGPFTLTFLDENGNPLAGQVRVTDEDANTLAEETLEGGSPDVEIPLTEDGPFDVIIEDPGDIGEGHLPQVIEVIDPASEVEVALEPLTENNTGKVKITVRDEDDEPVENARVMLRDKDTGGIVPLPGGEDFSYTDSEGVARLRVGDYPRDVYAYAVKYPARGGSPEDAVPVDLLGTTEFDIVMEIGTATLVLEARDIDNELVTEDTFYEVFEEDGNTITNKIPLLDGQDRYEIKAGRRVYVEFSHPALLSYRSPVLQLWPDTEYEVTGVLRPPSALPTPGLEFVGFFQDDEATDILLAGQKYQARFTLEVPQDSGFEEAGVHVRVGGEGHVDNAFLVLKAFNAPGLAGTLRGQTYKVQKNSGNETLTAGDAKWVNAYFDQPQSGTFALVAEVAVRPETPPSTQLALHYRAWGITADGQVLRSPFDAELGEQARSEEKDGLYAATQSTVLFEGTSPTCEDPVCLVLERIFDPVEALFLNHPYELLVSRDYNYNFVLHNNSQTQYNAVKLQAQSITAGAPSNTVEFSAYKLVSGDGQVEQENVFDESVGPLDVTGFSSNQDLALDLLFNPKQAKDAAVRLTLSADGHVIYENDFPFLVLPARSPLVTTDPDTLNAFSDENVEVTVVDEDGEPIEDARVRLTRTLPDGTVDVREQETGKDGTTTFELPPSPPGTEITLEVEKDGFAPVALSLDISEDVLDFEPEELQSSLNTLTKTQERLEVNITNKTGIPLTLQGLEVAGGFEGLLDEGGMNNYLSQFEGHALGAEETRRLSLVDVRLSPNAGRLMERSTTVEGFVALKALNPEQGTEYGFALPLNVEIELGGLPENTPCIVLDGIDVPDWFATIQANRAATEFEVLNACTADGRGVPLESLEARLEWDSESQKGGTVELSLISPDGATVTEVLREGMWTELFSEIPGDSERAYTAQLTFTPKSGFKGEQARFKVEVDGRVKTDQGLKFVGARQAINAEIGILNLAECLQMPGVGEEVTIARDEQEAEFTIDASACEVRVDVALCLDDPNCKGGTEEGGIIVNPLRFELTPTSPVKTVTVQRESIPGIYGVSVHTATPNTSLRRTGDVDVIVEPKTSKYFTMERFSFDLVGEESQDSTTFHNDLYQEMVEVKAAKAVFEDAQGPDWKLIGAGAGATTGFVLAAIALSCASPALILCLAVAGGAGVGGWYAGDAYGDDLDKQYRKFTGDENALEAQQSETRTLPDYVINLGGSEQSCAWQSNDPDSIKLDVHGLNDKISAGFNLASKEMDANTEKLGIVFTNTSNFSQVEPAYALFEVETHEHVHGDPAHAGNAHVEVEDANGFAPYCIPDTVTDTYTQKFHLRFTTQRVERRFSPLRDAVVCKQGSRIGTTGPKALPKLSMTWDFDKIDIDTCNPDVLEGVYCDSTQFSISLAKRLKRLEAFLAVNGYDFACPDNPSTLTFETKTQDSQDIPQGKLGLARVEGALDRDTDTLTVSMRVDNRTGGAQEADITVLLKGPDGYQETCQHTQSLSTGLNGEATCTFSGLPENADAPFGIKAGVTASSTTQDVDTAALNLTLFNGPTGTSAQAACWAPKSTTRTNGIPGLEYYINVALPLYGDLVNATGVQWPADWPGDTLSERIAYLNSLTRFKAQLMRDGYSPDFQQDFARFYSQDSFFSSPSWFATDATGRMADYFADTQRLTFTQKYVTDTRLPDAGLYQVNVGVDFGEDWRFYAGGRPAATVTVTFEKLSGPVPDSSFYAMPIDGRVGLESENGRQGYGTDYLNQGAPVVISEDLAQIRTEQGTRGTPMNTLTTRAPTDLATLNARAASRGALLTLEETADGTSMEFAPTFATPVIFSFNHAVDDHAFEAAYRLSQQQESVDTGQNLAFWTGLGACLDFTGVPIREVLDTTPDTKRPIEGTYALEWPRADAAGTVYASTVFYTPAGSTHTLASNTEGLTFATPDAPFDTSVTLGGISTMPSNSQQETGGIVSVESLFDLVTGEEVCVSESGTKTVFWWNPKTLEEQVGTEFSIQSFEQGLAPGETCIGFKE